METITLTCHAEREEAYQEALLQLGYTVLDKSWDDEFGLMTFVVQKKWLRTEQDIRKEHATSNILLHKLLFDYIEEESQRGVDEGHEFDSLVFWNQVTDAEEEYGICLQDAYDKVAQKYSFLHSSKDILAAHEAFAIHQYDGNY